MSDVFKLEELYKARTILLQQLDDLHYDISPYANASVEEVEMMMQNNELDMIIKKKTQRASIEEETEGNTKFEEDDKIFVHFYESISLRPDKITTYVNEILESDILDKGDCVLIITVKDISEKIQSTMEFIHNESYETSGIYVLMKTIKELQFNILTHSKVPKHTAIKNKNKVEMLMKKYYLNSLEYLPKISRFDPVAKVIMLRPGEVCEIIRLSPTALETPYYRLCVNE